MNSKTILSVLMIVSGLIVLGEIGSMDLNSETEIEDHYCEMVSLWNSQSHLPIEQRSGWPPYKGECHDK